VAWIHVQDQGGFPGSKSPGYVGMGYYLLEATGVLCALLLLTATRSGMHPFAWLLAAGVAAGPLLGFVLSRGPGLPEYTDDRGNWAEPLGLASVITETALLALVLTAILTARRTATVTTEQRESVSIGSR
jgi:hypothetical protein